MIKKTYICVDCRHKFTLTTEWEIANIEVEKQLKICAKCYNRMINLAVYGEEKNRCLNC